MSVAVFSVMALGSSTDNSKQVDEVHETAGDAQHEDGSVAVGEDTAIVNSALSDPSLYRRRSVKGKPRIPSAVDTSRLNKHLTNIWSSKRKKATKKHPSAVSLDSPQADGSYLHMESKVELSDHAEAAAAPDASASFSSQASTVIIVKTLPQKEAESRHSPAKVSKITEDLDSSEIQKGSRDIAERLKVRKQRFAALLGGGSVDASVNRSGQVTCELCAETVADYVQLVHHVCQQHEDCTYVRSYLDEIQPIADALSAVSLPCEACGRTFAGQAALAAHRHECSALSKEGHVSKLGAQRRRITASLLSPSEHASDRTKNGRQKEVSKLTTPVGRKSAPARGGRDHKCDDCKKAFSSPENLAKHSARVHSRKGLRRASSGQRHKPTTTAIATSKPAMAHGTKLQQPSLAQLPVSASTDGRFQRCDHCSASFSRMSLLITHMKYCLKADANR